jgi:Ca2+-binding RTX toxin-like protein
MAVIIGTPNDDILTGSTAADYIIGLDGNDILTGGAGAANQLQGGRGRDVYISTAVGDSVIEFADEGIDQVRTTVGRYQLPANVEELVYIGNAGLIGFGNDDDNLMVGGVSDDVLNGGLGSDTLIGGAGNDALDGGSDVANTMIGGAGNDTYYVSAVGDTVIENAGEGNDVIRTGLTSYTLPADVEVLIYTGGLDFSGGASLIFTGNSADNSILGGGNNDILNGGLGSDFLSGGGGDDILIGGDGAANTLVGGIGRDIYIVTAVGDTVVENFNGGSDQVRTTLARYAAPDNVEELVFTGTGDFVGSLGADGTLLVGGAGNDTLSAVSGTVQGGAGNDIFNISSSRAEGGSGNDRYFVGITTRSETDNVIGIRQIFENLNEGTDEVITSGAIYYLEVNVENLTYAGSGNFAGYGNGLANVITGGAGDDTLFSGGGRDILEGGNGNDSLFGAPDGIATLRGGTGNDTYYIFATTDVIEEAVGGGSDTVRVNFGGSFTIGTNIENFAVYGASVANTAITGNTSANIIATGAGNDTIDGLGGDDILRGFAGNDTISGGDGADQIGGGLGNDNLTGGAGADQFLFDSALSGTQNIDTITDFTAGSDRFLLDRAIFSGLNAGALSSFAYGTGSVATTGDQRILYDAATGFVRYDPDGAGGAAGITFAQLQTGLTLTAADFLVI